MRRLLVLFFVVIASAEESKKNKIKCEELLVDNKPHRKEILGLGLNRPYQLSYDRGDRRVYFSYNIGKDEEDSFEIGYLVKGHHEHRAIKSVENGFATAIDNKDGILYIGGSEGVFKKNLKVNDSEVEKLISEHDIWDMFFKDHLYFITYPMQHLYKLVIEEKGKATAERVHQVHEQIYQFAIDADGDMYITNETGLFRIKKDMNDRLRCDGPTVFRAIEVNGKGRAHFSGKNGIYVVTKNQTNTLEKIAHIKNLFGITFDGEDNIIYSDPHEIVKLLPGACK